MTHSSLTPQKILEAARQIRPELPNLLHSDQITDFDQKLAQLLAQAKLGKATDSEILTLLKSNDRTYDWIVNFLSVERVSKGPSLPGHPGSVSAPKYVCPEGDYVWFRRTNDSPIPRCPTHGNLVLDETAP